MAKDPAIYSKRNAAIGRLRSAMGPAKVAISDRLAGIEERYIGTGRDAELGDHIDELIFNAGSATYNDPGKRRALFVIGETGSGKSTAIRKAIADRSEFASYRDEDDRLIHPMVSFDAPGSLTLKVLARSLLVAIGYPAFGTLGEGETWELLKQQLVFRKVLFVHIDEMQHAVTSNNHATIEHLANTVKSLLQIPNWPLHMIMSGVPQLAAFREGDHQMRTRSILMEFERMTTAETDMLKKIVNRIIVVDAKMGAAKELASDEFIARLLHATDGAFGTCIQITRSAIARSLRHSLRRKSSAPEEIKIGDFAEVYSTYTACPPDQNIFKEKNWRVINPANALKRMHDKFAKEKKKKAKAENS